MAGHDVIIRADDGTPFEVYLVGDTEPARPAVIMFPPIFGVDADAKAIATIAGPTAATWSRCRTTSFAPRRACSTAPRAGGSSRWSVGRRSTSTGPSPTCGA